MLYKSTRGGESGLTFEQVLLSTYAADGGLYVPEWVPLLSEEQLCSWSGASFQRICAEIMHLYTGLEVEVLHEMAKNAYKDFNDGNEPPLPIYPVQNLLFLDASLGPTLAFKDIGQQMVAQLLNYYLGRSGRKATIVLETSGDTGPAAIAAVAACPHITIYCLYPKGRVSEIQELQMTTVMNENVHVYQSEGTTDDQASVLKRLFEDHEFVVANKICSINSINWARIAVQSTYYVWAYLQVYGTPLSIGRKVIFSIPTGAFGNAMGGYLAYQMGVPIEKIICATNMNDIVHRTISRGDMSMGSNVETHSPAMDIQFAYNIERMLYYIGNENPVALRKIMTQVDLQFAQVSGSCGVQLDRLLLEKVQRLFVSCMVNDDETLETINTVYKQSNFSLCPHSAIGVFAAKTVFARLTDSFPTICVLTANPAKFEKSFEEATGAKPTIKSSVSKLKELPQKFIPLRKVDEFWRESWITTLRNDIASGKDEK